MAVIRTQRLAVGSIAAGTTGRGGPAFPLSTPETRETADYVYTCPPDRRAVVRHIDLWIASPWVPPDIIAETYLGFVAWGLVDMAQGFMFVVGNEMATTSRPAQQWNGTAVLHPGDQIYVTSSKTDADLHYQISGAELVISSAPLID